MPQANVGESLAIDVARSVLAVRLEAVEEFVEGVLKQGVLEPRTVHQMRVATRRAGSALDLFESLLPEREVRRTRKRLRRIRRSAKSVRRCDAHIAILTILLRSETGPIAEGCAYALGRLAMERIEASEPLEDLTTGETLRGIRRCRKRLISALDESKSKAGHGSYTELAQATVPTLVDSLRSAVDADLAEIANMHALRLVAKHARYTLEILAPCAEPSKIDAASAALISLQKSLGAANDMNELLDRIASWFEDSAAAVAIPDRLAESLRVLCASRRDALAEYDPVMATTTLPKVEQLVEDIAHAFGMGVLRVETRHTSPGKSESNAASTIQAV